MNQPQRTKIFIADPHPEPALFRSFSEWGFVSLASQGPLLSPPYPLPSPLSFSCRACPKPSVENKRLSWTLRTANCLHSSGNLLFFDCVENNGFPGNLLTFVLVTASQNGLVQNTFCRVRQKRGPVERRGHVDLYCGSSGRGTEETDVGSIGDGDALVDLGCS